MGRIYLVDDHAMVRDGLRAMLEAEGHQVVGESADLTQSLADLVRLQPDVLLLDLNLQTRSGLELLPELRKRGLATRVLVVTQSNQPRHVTEALRQGASGYILKGSPRSELLRGLQLVLEGRKYLGEEPAEAAANALAPGHEEDPLAQLSARERQIITMVVNGQSSPMIGKALHLSPKTVDTYRGRLMSKLGVRDLPALVRFAVRVGLIDADSK
jgi:two-component system invasion response regulator UvrY